MSVTTTLGRAVGSIAGVAGLAAVAYAACVGMSWYRYGHPAPPDREEADPLLDEFMPKFDIAERHHVRVAASPEVTLSAAAETDLRQSMVIRAIFRARELVLGAEPGRLTREKRLLAEMTLLGWGRLAERPGREIVMGAKVRPWTADVVFEALPPGKFKAFGKPGYVKIAWTLRADPAGPSESIFRTETRVMTTDAEARRQFRWYWARFSPGIVLIRRVLLGQVKREAERREQLAER